MKISDRILPLITYFVLSFTADNFQWSASEDEDSKDDDNEEKETRSSSKRIGGGNQSGSRISRKSRKVTSPNMNPKKWKHDCDELIKEMCCLPYSVPFREPVSEIEFQCTNL